VSNGSTKTIRAMGLRRIVGVTMALLMLAATGGPSWSAAPSPVVRKIEVSGLKQIDKTSVRQKIYSQIGKPLNRVRVSEDIKRIFKMNFFDDVQVGIKPHPEGGVTLVFHITERPAIMAIKYDVEGDAVDMEDIKKVVDLKRFGILDEASIRYNLSKIEDLYIDEGHFLAQTRYSLQEVPGGVIVTLHVDEGKKVEVRHVYITGNHAVSASEIKGVMATKETGYFSFLTKFGQFKKQFFKEDIKRIQLLYLTKGFIQAQPGEPVVTLSPDKKWMTITVNIKEGPRFKVGDIDVEMAEIPGPDGKPVSDSWLIPKERLLKKVRLEKKAWFDYKTLQEDVGRIGDMFRDKGYANSVVNFVPQVDPTTRIVDITFKVQKGDLVYFRRINIRGNKSTRDKVIRRELKVSEGDLYSATGIRRSKRRVGVLGFFDKVDIKPQPTDRPDRMDLVVDVKEKQTGTFQVGAGFSSLESFIVTAQIAKDNFLGRGQRVSLNATLSAIRQLISLSFFEPYFFDTPLTFAFDAFNFDEDFVGFTRTRRGGNISFGYRLTDDISLSLTYTLEDVEATLRSSDIEFKGYPSAGLTSSLRLTAAVDTRNNRLFPSEGTFTTLSAEVAHEYTGSENEFFRLIGRTRWYFGLPLNMIFKVNLTAGWVASLGDNPVPLFERFFVGGIFTVRGFQRNSLGPGVPVASFPDSTPGRFNVGGVKELIFNAELEIPIFAEVGIRAVLFFDAGNAWDIDEDLNPLDMRTAVGFGFRWQSPVGPLRFEWGIPLDPREGEDPIVFEFTIGNSF